MENPHKEANLAAVADRSLTVEAEMIRIEREAIANFSGTFDDLELALGVLRLGHHVGWRVLVMIHNKRTIRRIENILEIDIREFFPPEGPSAKRSMGYKLALELGNFWKAVSGAIKIENRRQIADELLEES